MATPKPFLLFVYGTLMHPWVFRAVLGRGLAARRQDADGENTFWARRAILDGYKKISPDSTYQYAVPDPHGRISGYLIGPLPGECLKQLRRYEGKNYRQRTIAVHTGEGHRRAVVFIGNVEKLQHAFGFNFRDRLKQEVLLGEKIDAALLATEQQQLHSAEPEGRQALAELRGDTIRDLQRHHFDAGGISDYAIRHALTDRPLPSYRHLLDDPEARALSGNYLRLVVRQVILNQIEEHLFHDARYELDQMALGEAYYERTFSLLAALRLINRDPRIPSVIAGAMDRLSFDDNDLVDFVREGVLAANEIYDVAQAQHQLGFIHQHTNNGYIPLGAEMEFSDIGQAVIRDRDGAQSRDRRYDGFLYFYDFALDALTWKVGGHIDDHHDKAESTPRRGFFETAVGNLSVRADISKPVTNDPWTLNQLIHAMAQFYGIAPHSVHISLQLRSSQEPMRDRPLPLGVMKCLFAIAGDPRPGPDGRLVISRLVGDEIRRELPCPTMMFSQIAQRRSEETEDSHALLRARAQRGRYVQQFKFARLAETLNYEPLIVALKGLQLRYRPGNFVVGDQYVRIAKIRRACDDLLTWGAAPTPISAEDMATFLTGVRDGLMTERRGKPAHSEAYIDWSLDQLTKAIEGFNRTAGQ